MIDQINAGDLYGKFKFTKTIWAVGLLTLLHQLLIFRSLHVLDTDAQVRAKFNGWFGRPIEWGLRFFAILFLLCVGGEIPHVVSDFLNIKTEITYSLYPLFSVILFVILFGWDVGLLITVPTQRGTWPIHTDGQYFICSDFLGLLNWLALFFATRIDSVKENLPYILLIPFLIYFGLLVIRGWQLLTKPEIQAAAI